MQQSLTKALAAKLRISVPKVYARNGTPVDGPRGTGVSRGVWLSVVNEGFPAIGSSSKARVGQSDGLHATAGPWSSAATATWTSNTDVHPDRKLHPWQVSEALVENEPLACHATGRYFS